MSPAPRDHAVREEIRTNLDATLMVEAGAGTGKTTVLVDRIVELLRRGPHGVDQLAVLTFTEAAAAELAARVRDGLERELHSVRADSPERDRLRQALAALHRARIETIHAFAMNLLRERPVEAGLDPQFEVLDELGAQLAFDRSYNAWLADLLSGDRAEISTALHRGLDTKQLREIALQLHRARHVLPLAPQRTGGGAVGELVNWLESVRLLLKELLAGCSVEDNLAYLGGGEILSFDARLQAASADELPLDRTVLFRAPEPSRRAGKKGDWDNPDDCARVKELIGTYRDLLAAAQRELRAEAIAGVLPLVEQFVRRFEAERRAGGRAEFDDLLLWARDLVRDDAGVRAQFHDRFPRILVDEFQDTDPIQAELIMRIAADGDEPTDQADWRALRPARGHLFVVGDPKQSIYRFRRADIAVYDELRRGSLADGVRHITESFRSVPSLLDWANDVFDAVLVELAGVQPANVHLHASADGSPSLRPAVVAVHGAGEADLNAEAIRGVEGPLLARAIARAVRDERWVVRDRRSGDERACEWRDIALLVPSRTDLDPYTDALEELEVPFRLEGGTVLYARQEVRDLIACLHAIDDPNDRISLVAALRSMACGCSDEDLFMWVADGRALDLLEAPDDDSGPVPDALRLLAVLRNERRTLSLSELIAAVLRRTGLVEVALSQPHGQQAAASLLALVDRARAFSSSSGGDLRTFTRWLAERSEGDGDGEQEAGVTEETDDVVRILTIHGAKGLEFPIVALAKTNTRRPNDTGPLIDAEERRIELSFGKFATPGWDAALQREHALGDAERRRLLYVACTRARDHLIVPVVPAKGESAGMLAWLEPHLPEWDEECAGEIVDGCHLYDSRLLGTVEVPARGGGERGVGAAEIDRAEGARSAWERDRAELLEDAGREPAVITASGAEVELERPLALEISVQDDTPLLAASGQGREIGVAVHRVMELVELPVAGPLEPIANAVCAELRLGGQVAEVVALAERCLAAAVLERAIASAECWREVPFAIPWDGGLAVGRIDLLFVEDGRAVIVDYKTDSVEPDGIAAAVENHRSQAALYADAVTKTTGLPVAEAVFVFCRIGAEGSLAVSSAAD